MAPNHQPDQLSNGSPNWHGHRNSARPFSDPPRRNDKKIWKATKTSWFHIRLFIRDYLAVCHFYSVHPCLSTKISVSHLCGDHFPRTHSTEHAMSSGEMEKQVETSCSKTLRATNLTQGTALPGIQHTRTTPQHSKYINWTIDWKHR